MPKLIGLLLLFLCTTTARCQSLSGMWVGYFSDAYVKKNPIRIVFVNQADSSYFITSYSPVTDDLGNNSEVVCTLAGEAISADSLILQEKTIIKAKVWRDNCLQIFFLKFSENNNASILSGNWRGGCPGTPSGIVYLERKKEERAEIKE